MTKEPSTLSLTVEIIEGTTRSIDYHALGVDENSCAQIQEISYDQLEHIINGYAVKFAFGEHVIILCLGEEQTNE